jgi:HEAT repeat protein
MTLVRKPALKRADIQSRTDVRDFEGLKAKLGDPNPTARRWSARDLAAYPAASAALLDLVRSEEDVSVREVALSSLTQIGDETAVAGLVDCLRSEDARLRNEAIEAMKALPERVAPLMRGLLLDPDPDVRILAINVLESLRHPDVELWLISVIDSETVVQVCGAAVDLLTETGTQRSRDSLLRLMERFPDEPYIQFAAGLALKRIAAA